MFETLDFTNQKEACSSGPEMSLSEPVENLPVRGKGGSSMRLTLHSAGDPNGNAFPIFSSSSSSSSCLGESSPESLRSLSSLSGGRTDSPLDYDMLEVTLLTTVLTDVNKATDVVVPKWACEGGKQTELSESNDNSVTVYLDASSGEYHQDTWDDNDNLTQALSLKTSTDSQGNDNDLNSGGGRRHGSTTPDSDATEIPADDDYDDEEDALFLSLSSDVGIQRSSVSLTSLPCPPSEGLVISGGSAVGPEVTCPLALHVDNQTDPPASEHLIETTCILSSHPSLSAAHDCKVATLPLPEEAERSPLGSKPIHHPRGPAPRAAKTKPTVASPATKAVAPTGVKPSSMETKKVSGVGLKNVKAKVASRATMSPSKTPSQVKSLYLSQAHTVQLSSV